MLAAHGVSLRRGGGSSPRHGSCMIPSLLLFVRFLTGFTTGTHLSRFRRFLRSGCMFETREGILPSGIVQRQVGPSHNRCVCLLETTKREQLGVTIIILIYISGPIERHCHSSPPTTITVHGARNGYVSVRFIHTSCGSNEDVE